MQYKAKFVIATAVKTHSLTHSIDTVTTRTCCMFLDYVFYEKIGQEHKRWLKESYVLLDIYVVCPVTGN